MEKKRILIVEDERIVSEDLKMTLWSLGYHVEGAVPSGEKAIEIATNVLPDLVLMDIRLEGKIDGIKAAENIKKKLNIPVIYLTAYADENTLRDAKFTEPFGYLIKPFEDRELHATIEMAFYRHSMEEKLKKSKKKIELLHDAARILVTSETKKDLFYQTIKAAEEILYMNICYIFHNKNEELLLESFSSRLKTEEDKIINYNNEHFKEMIKKGTLKMSNLNGVAMKVPFLKEYQSLLCMTFGDNDFFITLSEEADTFNEDDQHMLGLLLGHTSESLKRIQLQEELKIQAIHDPLTNVYNRFYLYQSLAREIKLSRRHKHSIAFIMIDVNNLKLVNDKYGHHIGDEVLKIIADILSKEAREVDIVVRYGGDEFLIMLPETKDEVEFVKKRILDRAEKWNNEHNEFSFEISFAIGSAFWSSTSSETVDEVLAMADIRMYEDKRKKIDKYL